VRAGPAALSPLRRIETPAGHARGPRLVRQPQPKG